MQFNYGWSYVGAAGLLAANALVCSAQGTSAWHLNLDGHDYHWTVSEAHWLAYDWFNHGWVWKLMGRHRGGPTPSHPLRLRLVPLAA